VNRLLDVTVKRNAELVDQLAKMQTKLDKANAVKAGKRRGKKNKDSARSLPSCPASTNAATAMIPSVGENPAAPLEPCSA